jgi:Bacterial membrane protein YfhO
LNIDTGKGNSEFRLKALRRAGILLTLIALPFVYFAPAWIGGVALVQGDGLTANLGLRILTGRMISQGVLPLWNPFIFAGMPLLASIYPGVLYPFNWIFAVLSPGVAMQLVTITTYHIALIGAYCYARSLSVSRLGAMATGMIYAFGGYMVMSMGQTSNIATAAWLPWILLSIERLSQSESWISRWRWITFGSFAIALQFFGGVPQVTWYTALVAGAYSLFIFFSRSDRLPFLAGIAVMAIAGGLLSAIQLLPLRELQLQGARAGITYETFATYSFPPRQMLALVFPYFFGGAALPPYRIPYWGDWGIFITGGYTGLIGLALAIAALLKQRRRVVWFWGVVAVASLLLSFGDHLPLGLNRLLHAMPVYGLFRASFRHMFEFTFAVAVLAGIGLQKIAQLEKRDARRIAVLSSVALSAVVVLTWIAYTFAAQDWMQSVSRSAGISSLRNPEAFVPLVFLALSVMVIFGYARFRTPSWGAALLLVLFCDLASYGQVLEWRIMKLSVNETLRDDPPTVKFIKAREPVPYNFRVLSHSPDAFGQNYDLLNFPNLSIARGLQSVNGYDMLQMSRPARAMGEMTPSGYVQLPASFGLTDQAFNLLNVKYLLWEGNLTAGPVAYRNVRFSERPLGLQLKPGDRLEFEANGLTADELAVVSTLTNSGTIVEGTGVVKVRIHAKDGRMFEREIQAGRDTSEWAFDRADVRASIRHGRAEVVESWPAGGFDGHRYLARIRFDRAEIARVELEYARPDADILIMRASWYDSVNHVSTPVDYRPLPPERWRKLATFGTVDVYENQHVMPRTWFVDRVQSMTEPEAAEWIRNPDFKPAEVAALTPDIARKQEFTLPSAGKSSNAVASITRYDPQRIEIQTANDQSGFLVLSEVSYPGWEARVDGQPTNVYRTNYILRGISVPPGKHHVEFRFRSRSFHQGAVLSGLGGLMLLLGGILVGRLNR